MGGVRPIHSPLFARVRERIESHDGKGLALHVIVPHIRTRTLEGPLEGVASRVSIITTWHAADLESGASELSLWPHCRERGHALHLHGSIRLKAFSAGLRGYLLCMGNASERGMREGGRFAHMGKRVSCSRRAAQSAAPLPACGKLRAGWLNIFAGGRRRANGQNGHCGHGASTGDLPPPAHQTCGGRGAL